MKNNRKDKKANLESDDAQKPDIDAATDQSEKRNVLRRANEVNEDESTVPEMKTIMFIRIKTTPR